MIETVSAGGVVVGPDGKILVVSQHGNSWSLPKGMLEKGETLLEAARREIYEESGIKDLELVSELGSYKRFRMGKENADDTENLKHIHIFLFKTSETALQPVDPENPEARWVLKEEVATLLTHPKDREFFLSVVKKIQA